MSDEFDVVVVGAGPAGLTAAYLLANKGYSVLVVERGERPGSKNMFGGRLHTYELSRIFPNIDEAPLEREVKREVLCVISKRGKAIISLEREEIPERSRSFTVFRSKFDRWMADRVEEIGAMVITGIRVDSLKVENGKIKGIIAGEDVVKSKIVIAADGVLSLLARRAGLIEPLDRENFSVGVKEVIRLSEREINERFSVDSSSGVAMILMGWLPSGLRGEGFLYTMREHVSVGFNVRVSSLYDLTGSSENTATYQLIEEMKSLVKEYIDGGDLAEYSAHVIPENPVRRPYADGLLLVGDAAGLCVNYGLNMRGVDLAIRSGEAAAEVADEAMKEGDTSSEFLSRYDERLSDLRREVKFLQRIGDAVERKPLSNIINLLSTIYSTHPTEEEVNRLLSVIEAM